ncbi:hemerythrin domain-containing protein [Paenibacillus oryzisoli]|uniref:hemerythrin domain-containing protein n=1 Tax=Paenibacillus oryzisoli TaxID=1850517 RepID=UPI003D2764BC
MGNSYSLEHAHAEELARIVERLKEEHRILQQRLQHLLERMSHLLVTLSGTEVDAEDVFQSLLQEACDFMAQLEAHEAWEEQEAFPFFAGLAHSDMEPGFTMAGWIIEEDHKQAGRMLRAFLEQASAEEGPDRVRMIKAISLLDVACSMLTEHLTSEGEMLLPIADRLLQRRDGRQA